MLNFMQINEKNIEKPLCKNIDIFELPKLMQFLHITNSTISFFHLNTTIKYNYF